MYAVKRVSVFFIALAMVACAQYNPISQAETSQQKALAAYGSVTIMVEQVAALVAPDTLPGNVQARLILIGERGGETAKAGLAAYREADAALVVFERDASQQGRLNAAIASLDSWVTRAGPVIESLKTALRGAQ